MIFDDIFKAIGQLMDARFRRVLALGIGLTVALLIAIYVFVLWLVALVAPETVTLPWIGEVSWVNDLISGASVLLLMVLSVFLMVPVASAFTSLFLDQVADAVEDRYYPTLPPVQQTNWLDGLSDSLRFMAVIVVANLLALIVYAVMAMTIVLAPFTPLVFWSLNGYLLGREYFQLVAIRRMDPTAARSLFRRNSGKIWFAGALMAIPLSVPLVNLLVPIVGAATFTHLFHRLAR
jgi:CysZ protein